MDAYKTKALSQSYPEWWSVNDDGYILQNLARHLMKSGYQEELKELLCDIRWTLKRSEVGGLLALAGDFEKLSGNYSEKSMSRILNLIERNWTRVKRLEFPTKYFGHLFLQEREEKNMSRFFASIKNHSPKPFLIPVAKCMEPRDSRQITSRDMNQKVASIAVHWKSGKLAVALEHDIQLWNIDMHELLHCFQGHYYWVTSVAISTEGKVVVSGSEDETV